ncbi:MAG: hypothetical protein LBR15_03550 [Methanobrevibacter sp.]|jgi:anti-sigma regulatory factor (Ser/Thr protein kinase)|nr:hypothetical protein [Candidatus Methanovirga australis]
MVYSLLNDFNKFIKIMRNHDGSNKIDTSTESFLSPTTLIPLLCEINNKKIQYITAHPNTSNYIKDILNKKATNTRTPFIILPYDENERKNKELSHNTALKLNKDYGSFFVLKYIIAELTNNIYDHSSFEEGYSNQGYTYCQEYPNKDLLDICVMDDGLSIPGRFKKSGIEFNDECHAIEKAISNISTKSEDPLERGNGLWSTIKLVVEGNGGSALIVSDRGYLHIKNKENYKYDLLNNNDIFKGTLISLRLKKNQVQNIHELIEIFPGNPYKYKIGRG